MKWDLGNSCKGKFSVGQKVKTRGDFGSFKLRIVAIHNEHYCKCRDVLPFGILGKQRHINMNILEPCG